MNINEISTKVMCKKKLSNKTKQNKQTKNIDGKIQTKKKCSKIFQNVWQ